MSGMHPMGGRWLRTDRSALNARLTRKTLRRIGRFAVPHRAVIAAFLVVTVLDAAIVVVNPLLIKRLIDDGIGTGDSRLVTLLALAMVGVSLIDASFGVLMGWLSSRIGEGLIYDLRTKVFAHVQRMSLAFFTRTQTGALVSRLNNDVIGAQRAFTSMLSGMVSNSISVVVVAITMIALSWQVTLLCLATFPILILASRWVGARLAGLTRDQMNGNADLGNMMTERFNVGGALLLKLFGRRDEEDEKYGEKAAVVRDLGVRISLISRVFMRRDDAGAGAGDRARLRRRRSAGDPAVAHRRHPDRARDAAAAAARSASGAQSNVRVDVMTALVSFDRVFEVLDLPSTVQEKPGASVLPPDAASVEFDHVGLQLPAGRRCLAGQPGDGEPARRAATADQVLHDVSFRAESGQMVALVGPSGAGKTTITHLVARLYDVTGGRVRVGGEDVRDVTLQSLEDSVGYVTQDAHMFHDTIRRTSATRAPTPPTTKSGRRSRRRRSRPWCAGCPTGSRPSSATAATGSPAASGSGWRSPGCCSRRRRSWCSTRPPRTSTPSPSTRSSARSTRRSPAARRW